MKKFLAIALTLCMLFTSVVFVSADDAASGKVVVITNADDDTVFPGGELDTEVKAEGAGSRKFTADAGEKGVAAAFHIEMKPEATDITGTNFLVFELYISNAAAITGKQTFLELTSGGEADKEESAMQFFPSGLVDGWNTVVIPVADFTEETGGKLDPTRLNYIRWFNNASINVPENFQMNLDNIRFMDKAPAVEGGEEAGNVEEHIFRVFEASEEAYFVRSSAGKNDNQRFSDHNGETVYKFTVANRWGVSKVTFTAMVNAQLLLQVSQDDATWTDVYKWELPAGTPANKGLDKQPMTFDLTEFVDLEACADIYIRFADSHPVYVEGDVDPDGNPGSVGAGHGWGGSIHKGFDTTLAVEYTPLPAEELDAIEAASDENSVAVFGFNTKFGGMTIDKENKRAGSACANFDVHLGGVHQKKFDTPIDASGMDTLTFDLYVSDLALFDMFAGEGMNSGLELTSSGDADYQEVSWKLAGIRDRNIGDEIVVGWNHIILPLETADVNPGGDENNDRYGDFDISRIDFIRFFMVNEATDAGITLKIDNMRLDNSGIARAEAKAAADKAAADKVVERINKIGEVTLDSIRAIEKAEGEYAELTAEQQALVSNYDVLTAARAKYDELKAAEDNKPSGDENKPSDETTGEDEKPADENKPTDEKPVDEEGGSNVVIIIVVVAVVVVAAVVVVIILAKKKNKK